MKKIKPGVYYPASSEIACVDKKIIKKLANDIRKEKLKMGRYCLHQDEDSKLMSMLIIVLDKHIYPPHRHAWKDECYTIIKGECLYNEYSQHGEVVFSKYLKEGMSLMNTNRTFHTLIPKSSMVCFIENTTGPFRAETMEFL